VVSHNAVKHGLLANNVTVLPGEEAEYAYFAEAMRNEYGPDSTTEFLLVKKMIDAAWRQVRATKIEAGVLAAEMVAQQKQRQPGAEQESNGLERWLAEEHPEAIELGNAYARSEHLIATLSRCRVKLDREFYKALEELRHHSIRAHPGLPRLLRRQPEEVPGAARRQARAQDPLLIKNIAALHWPRREERVPKGKKPSTTCEAAR
jgi:2-oxo-4-hydroxy-4-carboxy--5-ureidoimidazoline (OHCU) decarboxylase